MKPTNGTQHHHDVMARVILPVTDSPVSWWINHPRDGWTERCSHELRRMKDSKFGRMLGSNLAGEFAAPEPRNRKGTGVEW